VDSAHLREKLGRLVESGKEARKAAEEAQEAEAASRRARVEADRDSAEVVALRASLSAAEVEARRADDALSSARSSYAAARARGEERRAALAEQAKTLRARLAGGVLKLRAAEAGLAEQEARSVTMEFWREAFGPRGIRRYRIGTLIPAMNASAERYSRLLFGDSMLVRYSATREGAKGQDVEEFTLDLVDAAGTSAVAPSAGQRARRDVIHTMVACDAAGRLGRRPVACLAFDEVFSSLDEAGTDAAYAMLAAVSERTKSMVMVIEHSPVMSHLFKNRLVATRRGGEVTYAWA
jgi:DNA repair exonuclease SbcCD ATPase subunit